MNRQDPETRLLLCDVQREDAQREALRQRQRWREGAGDPDALAAAEARLRAANEVKRLSDYW